MIDLVLSHCGFWKVQVQKSGNKNDVVVSWSIISDFISFLYVLVLGTSQF